MYRRIRDRFTRYKQAQYNKEKFIGKYYLNYDDNAVIRIVLKDIDEAFSRFSPPGYEELDGELSDYIDGVIYNIPLKHHIILDFYTEKSTHEQEKTLEEVILNFYGLRLEDKNQDLRINTAKVFGLFAVGSILLIFSYFLANNETGRFFTDVMNIAGTFAIWEVVDLFILERKSLMIEKLNAGQTVTAQIVYNKNIN